MTRITTEIGEEVACAKCGEMWPMDEEFFHPSKENTKLLCIDCHNNGQKKLIQKQKRDKVYKAIKSAAKYTH